MPEGPSIVILKEEASQFEGQHVKSVYGNTSIDITAFQDQKIQAFKSWGKHFLICFKRRTIRIHLLLFGSYRINERKETNERIGFSFDNGELNFYACSVKILEGNINSHYDFTADVMNPKWNASKARKKLAEIPNALICDALLEQEIFAGVGNIIKNEVLYRVKVHPEALIADIPIKKLNEIIKQARVYSFEFLGWKKNYVLKKHWLAHTKKTCLRCDLPFIKKQTGLKKRRSFFCNNCQSQYNESAV